MLCCSTDCTFLFFWPYLLKKLLFSQLAKTFRKTNALTNHQYICTIICVLRNLWFWPMWPPSWLAEEELPVVTN